MYTTKQQVINKYLESMDDEVDHTFNKVDDVVWVSTDKMMAILKEHALLRNHFDVRLPPMVEADWDTNDTKEFDRLLHKMIVQGPGLLH
jgi:hypothetical protein